MKRPIDSDDYWMLRAVTAETQIAVERGKRANTIRNVIVFVTKTFAAVEMLAAEAQKDVEGSVAMAEAILRDKTREIGERLGFTGDPDTWSIDLRGPADSFIRTKEEDREE